MTHTIMLRLYGGCASAAVLAAGLSVAALRRHRGDGSKGSSRARNASLCLAVIVPGGAWSVECLGSIWLWDKWPNYSFLAPLWAIAMLAIGTVFLASFRPTMLRNDGGVLLLARLAALIAWSLGVVVAAVSFAYI